MNLAEELQRLDAVDLATSQRFIQRLVSALNVSRDTELLSDLIDYQLTKNSKPALRVLISLKDIHSQDFFAKLHDCLLKTHTRLKSLILLGHMLNGEASWLYKTVDSPVFIVLLQFLRSSDDLILLSSTLYILCSLLPLSPFHTSKHLPDLFEGFTRTATLKTVLGKIPKEMFLGLDMALLYFFLQLYALYPCKFLQYLKARFGPTGEVQTYNEHIAPLFQYVQLHPNLITDIPNHETQRTRWSSKEPYDIATLALSLCIDPSLHHLPTATLDESADNRQLPLSTNSRQSPYFDNRKTQPTELINHVPSCDPSLCGPIEDAQLADIWSPLVTLGNVTPSSSSHPPSRLSNFTSTPSFELDGSQQTTPLPTFTEERKFSYSPTASVEGSVSIHSNNFESSQKATSPGSSSGRNSPTVKSAGNTPRSFRHIVSDIFRRSNVANVDNEDFTNISASEVEAVMDSKKEPLTRSLDASDFPPSVVKVGGFSLSLKVPEPDYSSSQGEPKDQPLLHETPSQVSRPPSSSDHKTTDNETVTSYSADRDILVAARDRLDSLRQTLSSSDSSYQRKHSNSVFLASYDSIATLTSQENDRNESSAPTACLLHKTVSNVQQSPSNDAAAMSISISPATALYQYIQNGNILHIGRLQDVSLTDLPGTNWDHFGGCPHSEELKVKTGLAAILHSQVLFERYQCQQHAKRNRRLMCKARTTAKLESEVLALRCRLHQQEELIVNLQSDVQNTIHSKDRVPFNHEAIISQNKSLRDSNQELREEIQRLKLALKKQKNENKQLTKRIHDVESIQKENDSLRKKLTEVPQLQTQMENLLKEQLVIEELYHQQKMAVSALRRENTELQQMKQLCDVLTAESKDINHATRSLKQEVSRLKLLVKEREKCTAIKDRQISELKNSLEKLQLECNEKLEILERKYQNARDVNQQLEEKVFQLQATHLPANSSPGHS